MPLTLKIVLSFLLIGASAFTSANQHNWQKTDYITHSFLEVAMGSEFGNGSQRIRKWVKPLRIYVEHQAGDQQIQDSVLNAHLARLRDITGLKITRVSKLKQANLHIFFTPQKALKSITTRFSGARVASYNKAGTCLANLKTTGNAEMHSAQIYIPVEFAYGRGKLVSCIVEEMTQVLGLPRDSEKVFPSIFNDKSHNDLLTGLDETLIRILYDAKIKPGMAKQAARTAVKNVIKKLNNQGLIKRADLNARKAPLFNMLYS